MTSSTETPARTRMFQEAGQASEVVRGQLVANAAAVARIGARLRAAQPRLLLTCARGSSDHAATFVRYLVETRSGVFTASAAPSVISVYAANMDFRDCACLLISQSGASPDLLAFANAARSGGALVIALVNVGDSPLAQIADEVLELRAGPETSVAATKSFIASLAAGIHLLAAWRQDDELAAALAQAPQQLRSAWNSDWSAALEPLAAANNLFVLGRGPGLGVAQEAALKFKEVCGLHAEAYSSAEVLHGPISIAGKGVPALFLAQHDASLPGMARLLDALVQRGLCCITAGLSHPGAIVLPSPEAHPAIEPMLRIQGFYRLVNELSLQLGRDPDRPPFLNKVTATV